MFIFLTEHDNFITVLKFSHAWCKVVFIIGGVVAKTFKTIFPNLMVLKNKRGRTSKNFPSSEI